MTDAALNAPPVSASDELESPARRALRRLFKRKGAVAGLVVIAIFIVLAVFAPLVSPFEPIATSWSLVRKPPSASRCRSACRSGSCPAIAAASSTP